MTLRNLKIVCSWNGKNFSGYQIQPHARTVEGTLNKAWKTLTSCDECVITGCSRLDSGVHAFEYVFNVLSPSKFSPERIVKSLNGILHNELNAEICIYSCEEVENTFHARFSAVGKHYRYLIWHGFSEHQFYKDFAWHVKTKHSFENFERILKLFEGKHNFNSFRASDCGSKNTTKTIYKITLAQDEKFPELYTIDIYGDGFLKNMIRNIIGMSLLVINQKKEISEILERVESGKRGYNLCAPAHGLSLIKVYYNLTEIKF